jgi:hypothetical protein
MRGIHVVSSSFNGVRLSGHKSRFGGPHESKASQFFQAILAGPEQIALEGATE